MIQDGKAAEATLRQDHDQAHNHSLRDRIRTAKTAQQELIQRHTGMIRTIGGPFHKTMNAGEAIALGENALITAARSWKNDNADKNTSKNTFAAYAAAAIRNAHRTIRRQEVRNRELTGSITIPDTAGDERIGQADALLMTDEIFTTNAHVRTLEDVEDWEETIQRIHAMAALTTDNDMRTVFLERYAAPALGLAPLTFAQLAQKLKLPNTGRVQTIDRRVRAALVAFKATTMQSKPVET